MTTSMNRSNWWELMAVQSSLMNPSDWKDLIVQSSLWADEGDKHPGVCTTQWNGKLLGFRCRDCQNDASCLICVDCFFNSDHDGHETELTLPEAGCCDCGDTSSWALEGCCSEHQGLSDEKLKSLVEQERKILEEKEQLERVSSTIRWMASTLKVYWSISRSSWDASQEFTHDMLVRHLQELTTTVAASFYVRHMVESVIFEKHILHRVLSSRGTSDVLPSVIVTLLLTLVPRLGFKERCAKYALIAMPIRYRFGTIREISDDGDVGSLAVQMFTVEQIATDNLVDGTLEQVLAIYVGQTDSALPEYKQAFRDGPSARHWAHVVAFIFSAAKIEALTAWLQASTAFPPYIGFYYRANLQQRARVHVEFENNFEAYFEIELRIAHRLVNYFAHCQTHNTIKTALRICERTWPIITEDTVKSYGVTFHYCVLRFAMLSFPLDRLLSSIVDLMSLSDIVGSNCEIDRDEVDCLKKFAKVSLFDDQCPAIRHITTTFVHTFAIQSFFWRRNGRGMIAQALTYARSYYGMRLDTVVLLILTCLRAVALTTSPETSKSETELTCLLTPLVKAVLQDPFESNDEETAKPSTLVDASSVHLDCINKWRNLPIKERITELALTVDHHSASGTLMRLMSLWHILAGLCDWGIRNLELLSGVTTLQDDGKNRNQLIQSDVDRLWLILGTEYVCSAVCSKMSQDWDLPCKIPEPLLSSLTTQDSVEKLIPSAYELLTRPTLQCFQFEKSEYESFLSQNEARELDTLGVHWNRIRVNRLDAEPENSNTPESKIFVNSWAGKILIVASLLERGQIFEMCCQILSFLADYEVVDSQSESHAGVPEEVIVWEQNSLEEILVSVCRVIVNIMIPLWSSQNNSDSVALQSVQQGSSEYEIISGKVIARITSMELAKDLILAARKRCKDHSLNKCVDGTIRRLNTLVSETKADESTNNSLRRGSDPGESGVITKADLIKRRQDEILDQYKSRQLAFLAELGSSDDSDDEVDEVHTDDYYKVNLPIIEHIRQLKPAERVAAELFPRGTQLCAVCHEGPTCDGHLVMFLNISQLDLLTRLITDPVVGNSDGQSPILPLTGTTLAQDSLPRRSGVASSCGHCVHEACVPTTRVESHNCPICRREGQYLLPVLPSWALVDKDLDHYPFWWRDNLVKQSDNAAASPRCDLKVPYSRALVVQRLDGHELSTFRAATAPVAVTSEDQEQSQNIVLHQTRPHRLFRTNRLPFALRLATETRINEESFIISPTTRVRLRAVGIVPVERVPVEPESEVAESRSHTSTSDDEASEHEASYEEHEASYERPVEEPDHIDFLSLASSDGGEFDPPAAWAELEQSVSEPVEGREPEEASEDEEENNDAEQVAEGPEGPEAIVFDSELEGVRPEIRQTLEELLRTYIRRATRQNPPRELGRDFPSESSQAESNESSDAPLTSADFMIRIWSEIFADGDRSESGPDKHELNLLHSINLKTICRWSHRLQATFWQARQRLTALFYVTYLEICRTARHNPLAIAQIAGTTPMFALLLRALCLVHPAEENPDLIQKMLTSSEAWRWPTANHVNHTELFLKAFLHNIQLSRDRSELISLVQLQVAMLTLSASYNYLTQRLKLTCYRLGENVDLCSKSQTYSTRLTQPNLYLRKLATDLEIYALGPCPTSLTQPSRHLEISLRHLERPDYTMAWLGHQSAERQRMREAKKFKHHVVPPIWRCSAYTLLRAKDRSDLKMSTSELAELIIPGLFDKLSEIPDSRAVDRLRPEAYAKFSSHNRMCKTWDVVALFENEQAQHFRESKITNPRLDFHSHLKEVWHAACVETFPGADIKIADVDFTANYMQVDVEELERLLVPILTDYLTFVFTTFAGIFRFEPEQQRVMNQLSLPASDPAEQLAILLSILFEETNTSNSRPSSESLSKTFNLLAYTSSDRFEKYFARSLDFIWDREVSTELKNCQIIPLPRVTQRDRTPPNVYRSPLQIKYKMGPGLPTTFYECVKLIHRRACSQCRYTEPHWPTMELLCMFCGACLCQREETLIPHVIRCTGSSGILISLMKNACIRTLMRRTGYSREINQPLYTRHTGKRHDAPLDKNMIDVIFAQLILSTSTLA